MASTKVTVQISSSPAAHPLLVLSLTLELWRSSPATLLPATLLCVPGMEQTGGQRDRVWSGPHCT